MTDVQTPCRITVYKIVYGLFWYFSSVNPPPPPPPRSVGMHLLRERARSSASTRENKNDLNRTTNGNMPVYLWSRRGGVRLRRTPTRRLRHDEKARRGGMSDDEEVPRRGEWSYEEAKPTRRPFDEERDRRGAPFRREEAVRGGASRPVMLLMVIPTEESL